MTNQYLTYDKQQWQRVCTFCIIATFHMEDKCQYRIRKFDSIGPNLTSLDLEDNFLIFDDVHSSACNIGHFLGQAFLGIFSCFLKCIEKELQI